jgi:hypothetical protein
VLGVLSPHWSRAGSRRPGRRTDHLLYRAPSVRYRVDSGDAGATSHRHGHPLPPHIGSVNAWLLGRRLLT